MRFPLVKKSRLGAVAKVVQPLQLLLPMFLALSSANSLQAALSFTPVSGASTAVLNCNTLTGPGANLSITLRNTGTVTSNITVTASQPNGVTVTAGTPANGILTSANNAAGIPFVIAARPACAGATAGTNNTTITFTETGGATTAFTFSYVVTVPSSGASSALGTSVNSLALTCVLDTGNYTAGLAQTVNVTSSLTAAQGGTPFTVDTSASGSVGAAAAWVTVTPRTGTLNANSTTPVALSVVPTSGCGGFAVNTTNTTTITLLNAPAPARVINVTLRILAPSPLIIAPSSAALTYVKGSGTPGRSDILLTASTGAPFFTVDTTSLPIWLTVDAANGTVPRTLRFSSTTVADTLAAGTYSATVRLRVSGFGDRTIPVTLSVNNQPARLTVSEGLTRSINWVVGSTTPSLSITAVSSDSPIPYTITTSGRLAPIVASSLQSGLAYSFGTAIPVTFDPLLFASAVPGTNLTGVVSISWGNPVQTTLVTININVQSSAATLSGISPASLPTANPGATFTAVLTGAGFIPGTDPATRTRVGIVSSGNVIANTNISSNVVNGSNIIVTFTVPTVADTALPFSPTGNGGSVVLGICNPINGTCTSATGTATLTIGNNPIIDAITSASAFQQVTAPAVQRVAPYDMITIFGSNFCAAGGTGCSSSQILYATPDPATLIYPRSLSPDAAGASQRSTVVTFFAQGSTTPLATAPLLFVTNNQINAMVPGSLSAGNIDVVVSFGFGTGTTLRSSLPMPLTVVAANPGIFTIGSNGQGDAAVLDSNWSVISASNPAGVRSNTGASGSNFSEVVQLYLTGLGNPSTGANNNAAGTSGGAVWGDDCVSVDSYRTSLSNSSGVALSSIGSTGVLDGAIFQSSLLNTNRLVPCIATGSANSPTLTIGGQSATILYAGFVPDAIGGLYQINARLPVNTGTFTNSAGTTPAIVSAPIQLPVVVTAGGRSSQSSVSLWVAPRLRVLAPTILSGTVGTAWSTTANGNRVVASQGTGTLRYAVTSGLLPSGLALSATDGGITGTPAANTSGSYLVTVTATDSANTPVTGSVNFTLQIAGGLVLSSSETAPFTGTFGTANSNITTISAAGGVFSYTYAITTPSSLPVGMAISSGGALSVTDATPAGTYNLNIRATDSTSGTALVGNLSLTYTHALNMTNTSPASLDAATSGAVTTVSATGQSGTLTYSMASATGFTFNAGTRVVSYTGGTLAAGNYSVVVTATDSAPATGATGNATRSLTIPITIAP